MTLPKTQPDAVLDPSDLKCPGYRNANTPWWDGSQIYGSSEAATEALRSKHKDGKLTLVKRGNEEFLPTDAQGNFLTGFNSNFWVGIDILHTLFALEHNAICDAMRRAHPDWTG